MKPIESASVSGWCHSVCQLDDLLLMGTKSSGVEAIKDGRTQSLINLKGAVNCVRVHNEHIYLLYMVKTKWSVRKHKMKGDHVKKWEHVDSATHTNQFTIHQKVLYVPSRSTKTIKRYAMSGDHLLSVIRINLLDDCSATHICMSCGHREHLILSQNDPSLLVCINPETKEQLWSRQDLPAPGCVASDNYDQLLVVTGLSRKTIEVLRTDTGVCICD